MKTYYLKLKESREVINRGKFENIDEAIEFFSSIKQMNVDDLLKLFIISI